MAKPAGEMADTRSRAVKTLFVFDFDHTLIDDNSDTNVMSLCSELTGLTTRNLSSKRLEYGGWTKFMDHVFSLIHEQGHTKEDITKHMKEVRLYDQALDAVHALHKCEAADSIILSDSNTIFIDIILDECGVKDFFDAVITNPAHFDETGRLHVREYHAHNCDSCERTPNLCKGQAMKEYINNNEHKCYERVVYVGDGKNDYCPCLKLAEKDVVICREGYPLAERLKHSSSCLAQVYTIDFISGLGDLIKSKLL